MSAARDLKAAQSTSHRQSLTTRTVQLSPCQSGGLVESQVEGLVDDIAKVGKDVSFNGIMTRNAPRTPPPLRDGERQFCDGHNPTNPNIANLNTHAPLVQVL